jgi:hypothetical protein
MANPNQGGQQGGQGGQHPGQGGQQGGGQKPGQQQQEPGRQAASRVVAVRADNVRTISAKDFALEEVPRFGGGFFLDCPSRCLFGAWASTPLMRHNRDDDRCQHRRADRWRLISNGRDSRHARRSEPGDAPSGAIS